MDCFSIAIDGPAGAGKSTIAKKVAQKLQFIYVDTGAMYRAMGLYFVQRKVDFLNQKQMQTVCQSADISIVYQAGEQQVILNQENVTPFICTEEAGKMASVCAANGEVRKKLVELQRQLANKGSVVMDGRDIGTQVLPKAELKLFLTASSQERARRRFKELSEKGISCDLAQIEANIIERDEQDRNREISPLCQAKDAILIDSSQMTIDEVVEQILTLYGNRTAAKKH